MCESTDSGQSPYDLSEDDYERLVREVAERVRHAFGSHRFRHASATDFAQSGLRTYLRRKNEGQEFQIESLDDLVALVWTFARHRALNETRKKNPPGLDRDWELQSMRAPSDSQLLADETREIIEQTITDLGSETGKKIVRRRLDGHSNSVIADNLGISIRTVERAWKLFVDKLQKTLRLES
ncbi:MAG: sigma-70 family RNA polymerase sigma factor [Pirellulaceae bacterium]